MLPDRFTYILQQSLGPVRAQSVMDHLGDEPSVSVRANPFKIEYSLLRGHFASMDDGQVPWCENGLYLSQRPSFTMDPWFHAGAYYVQEASSMYVGSLLKPYTGDRLRVLDLCAAPGGKSTLLLSLFGEDSLLVANEVNGQRASVLAENLARWGSPNVCITNSDPSAFSSMRSFFDIALIDAPCSGEGMFRKDEEAVLQWSEDNVKLCASRQRRILSDVWPSIRPGGVVVYSTCTFNKYEDEENASWICSALGAELLSERHFLPGEDRGEGFYCALLRKDGQSTHSTVRASLKRYASSVKDYLLGDVALVGKGEMVKAYPEALAGEMLYVESHLKCIRSGVAVASIKGRDAVPEADLALSTIYNRSAFTEIPLSQKDALKFLAREPLSFPCSPKGYLCLSYEDLPLGFVKNLGNRSNSLLPPSRRIRASLDIK